MEPFREKSGEPAKHNEQVRDLGVDDLFEQGASTSDTSIVSSQAQASPVMLPHASCFKGRMCAQEDVLSSSGKCLVRAGEPFSLKLAEPVALRRMSDNPLSLTVNKLDLDITHFIADFQQMLSQREGLKAFVAFCGGIEGWQGMLASFFPVSSEALVCLAQLRKDSPPNYEQSLFCSWLGVILGKELEFDEESLKNLFLAGLFHQLGRLHLPKEIRYLSENHCQKTEWNEFQIHVLFGKLMLNGENTINQKELTDIILQQGEYGNSLGYPFSLDREALRPESLVLSLSRDLYQFLFVDGGVPFDALLFLQLHEARFGQEASWAMQRKIKAFLAKQNRNAISGYEYNSLMASYLIETSIVLAQLHTNTYLLVNPVKQVLENTNQKFRYIHLENLLAQIEGYKNNSGIADLEFVFGLDSMQHEDARSLNDEIYQIIQRQRGLLTLFIEIDFLAESVLSVLGESSNSEAIAEIKDLYALIHDAIEPYQKSTMAGVG